MSKRFNDASLTTITAFAADDFFAVDGATNGARKMAATAASIRAAIGLATTDDVIFAAITGTSVTIGAGTLFDSTKVVSGYVYLWSGTSNAATNTFVGQGSNTAIPPGYTRTSAASACAFGYDALVSLTSGGSNSAFGREALKTVTTGTLNSAFGSNALKVHTGSISSAFGSSALTAATGNGNTAFGYFALGAVTSGTGNVGLGAYAGRYATGSNEFYVDNQDRTNNGNEVARALLYGTFNATAANQTLKVNAALTVLVGFGCNGASAQTAYASGGAATDPASTQTLANNIRSALIANGIMS